MSSEREMGVGNATNRWKDAVLGVAGSIVGLAAMRLYWQKVAPEVGSYLGSMRPDSQGGDGQASPYPPDLKRALESIALIGRHHREGEVSTAAIGRIVYAWVTGREPESDETQEMLSYLVHYVYGLSQGAIYGTLRGEAGWPDVAGGIAFATALWLFGDEMVVPMLGLQTGPTAVTPTQHLNRWGAHLFYGTATAAATQTLRRLL